ncbi:MAG: hypothetical protein N2515_09825, partial [Deltaproteobacteria bacterium]|nr:hypothetical protein [Deltaproteobacteria bacterium]
DMVKVTAIATGFPLEATPEGVIQESVQSRPRNALVTLSSSHRSASRPGLVTAPAPPKNTSVSSRSVSATHSEAGVGKGGRRFGVEHVPAAPRVFGPAALHDEAMLDIPAYLRRASMNE